MATLPIARAKQPKHGSPMLNPEIETHEVATRPNVNRIPMATPNTVVPRNKVPTVYQEIKVP